MPSVWPGNFEANQLLVTKQEAIFQTGHREWALLITGLSPLRGLSVFIMCWCLGLLILLQLHSSAP